MTFATQTLRALVLIVLMALAATACKKSGAEAKRATGPGGRDSKPVLVVAEVVRHQPWQDVVKALGTVKARESVNVTAKVSETVQQVHFHDGQAVARGAALVTLTGTQQQAALRSAEATAREAEQLFRRQQQLASRQLISRAMFDQQRATRDAALAQVAQVRANLSDRVIRAPFSGMLGLRQVSPGALVTPGTVIATLDDLSRVYVDFPLPEAALAGVASGQSVTGTAAAWPEQVFHGQLSTVGTRIDSGSRSLTMRADFPNPDRRLKPGMLVNVDLSRGEVQALVVPELAVQQVGSETFVWRIKPDGSIEKAEITVGGRVPGKVMVKEGLNAGDRIVTAGVGKVKAGSKVTTGATPSTSGNKDGAGAGAATKQGG